MQNTCAPFVWSLIGFTAMNYCGNYSFLFSSACFYPDGWSYLVSMDSTFLNNEVQICMYPTHLNVWGAAGPLIISIVCLFALTSLTVSLLMRQTDILQVLLHGSCIFSCTSVGHAVTKIYPMPPLPLSPPPLELLSPLPLLCVFKSLILCISGLYTRRSNVQNWNKRVMKKKKKKGEIQSCICMG